MAPGVSSKWQQTWSVHQQHSSATSSGSEWLLAAVSLSCASVFVAAALSEQNLSLGCPITVQRILNIVTL